MSQPDTTARDEALGNEQNLLGAIMLDPHALPEAERFINTPDVFTREGHSLIWRAVVKVIDRHNAVDPDLLAHELTNTGVLKLCGGEPYIDFLFRKAVAVNVGKHAQIIADRYRLRRLAELCADVIHESKTAPDNLDKYFDDVESRLFSIGRTEADASKIESLAESLEKLMNRQATGHDQGAVATGFPVLDAVLGGGFFRGELIVLAARPSVGKTALAMNIAEQIGLGSSVAGASYVNAEQAKSVGVFSLEMTRAQIVDRLVASWTGLTFQDVRKQWTQSGKRKIEDAVAVLKQAKMCFDESSSLTIAGLRQRARRMVQQFKCDIIIVDYLQLLTSPAESRESRQVEVSSIARGLKSLARELKVPILALSQLNRRSEDREDGRPKLSDLRESGAIEQDADVVLLLFREAAMHRGDKVWLANNPTIADTAEIIVAKQRNGPLDSVPLMFDAESMRFKSGVKVREYDHGINYVPPTPEYEYDGATQEGA